MVTVLASIVHVLISSHSVGNRQGRLQRQSFLPVREREDGQFPLWGNAVVPWGVCVAATSWRDKLMLQVD